MPFCSIPPAISTLPFRSKVAVWLKRAVVVLPVGTSVPGPAGVRVANASKTRTQNSVKAESPSFARKFIGTPLRNIYKYRTYQGRTELAEGGKPSKDCKGRFHPLK